MKHNNNEISLKHAINQYIRVISESRSQNTARSYSQAITKFTTLLTESNIDTDTTTITSCSESWIIDFIGELGRSLSSGSSGIGNNWRKI